jgi:hypothetical protein
MIMACCDEMKKLIDAGAAEFYPGWHDSLPHEFRRKLRERYGPANLHQPRVLVMHTGSVGPVPMAFCLSCGFMLLGQIETWER